jgi:hypothetical protein
MPIVRFGGFMVDSLGSWVVSLGSWVCRDT